ncbi:MAG TPA: hypothetical protein VJH33_00850 [Candidatus Paceibacterota bacterium]
MDSGALYIRKETVDKALATPPVQGKRNLEPFTSLAKQTGLPLQFLEDTAVSNNAEIHVTEDDLWMCVEGEVTFLCGGTMKDPWFHKRKDGTENKNEIRSNMLENATTYMLNAGDWLWIPAGVPHQHSAKGTARLAIIKIYSRSTARE